MGTCKEVIVAHGRIENIVDKKKDIAERNMDIDGVCVDCILGKLLPISPNNIMIRPPPGIVPRTSVLLLR